MTLTLTTRRIAGIAAVLVVLFAAYLLATSRDRASAAVAATTAAATPSTAGISVSGVGKMSGTPDTLRLQLSISASAKTVSEALRTANSKAAAVQKSLRDSGVDAKDLQTTAMNIQPDYSLDAKGRSAPQRYQVQEGLSAVLRDLDTAGAAISAAASVGGQATRIDSVELDLDDTSTLVTGARANAFAEARRKADQYARAAGVSVGQVLTIQESVQAGGPQPYDYAVAQSARADAVPIQAGSQELSVTVTVTFAIA